MDSKSSKKILSALFAFPFFALTSSLFPGCIGVYDDISLLVDKARCDLRVGILSDTHHNPPGTDKMLRKALAYFAEREVDAVVIAGDVTQAGNLVQWRSFRNAWDKAFPNGKRPDGSPVALVAVTGESDNEKVYAGLSGQPYSTVFSQEVRGYIFIGANWKDATGVDAWALKPFLAKVDRTKPFFYVQNLIPYGTCCPHEGRLDVFEGGKISYLLSKFPNAIAICGRSHTPLTDESAFWHGEFTCVNAGAFSYARMRGTEAMGKKDVYHGMVMSVYDSSVVFERIDFGQEKKGKGRRVREGVYVEKLGKDWAIELPARPSVRPETAAPQFWDDTRLAIFPSEKIVSVRFPPVLAKHTGVRAYAYDVVAKASDGTELSSCTTWSPGFCASEANETKPVTVNFPRKGLPKGKVVFEVTPIDAFGKRGRPVVGEVTL